MSTLSERTRKKYHGRKAETYEEIRQKQTRWRRENEIVEDMLINAVKPRTILDCPVGTGRFLPLYKRMGVRGVRGLDASETMLRLARRKVRSDARVTLTVGDASHVESGDKTVDCVVCVRFLDLIDESFMQSVVRELCRVARCHVILTIRLGDVYVEKVNTAEHDRGKFLELVSSSGFTVARQESIFDAGWTVMLLERRE